MSPEQERLKNLLTDTVTLLCKNGLKYQSNLRIEGLLAVSLDNSEVFFVHISETTGDPVVLNAPEQNSDTECDSFPTSSDKCDDMKDISSSQNITTKACTKEEPYNQETNTYNTMYDIKIKQEKEDIIIIKEEVDNEDSYDDCSSTSNTSHTYNSKNRYHPYQQFSNVNDNNDNRNNFVYQSTSSTDNSNKKMTSSTPLKKFSNNMTNLFNSDNNQTPNFPSTSANSESTSESIADWASQDFSSISQGDPMHLPEGEQSFLYDIIMPRRRRTDGPRKYLCSYPDCSRAFMHGRNLWRHEVLDHGRPTKKQGYTYMNYEDT